MRRASYIAIALALSSWLYAQPDDAKPKGKNPSPTVSVRTSSPNKAESSGKNGGKAKSAIAITPEREAAAIAFVQRNHAELADLLGYLKTSQPEEYERAIKEIYRTTERLAQIIERDPLQYELEVAAWTAQSRVQLLAAKLQMGSSDDLVKQLREALKSQNAAKLALLKHDRQKVTDRLSKIDSDIARFESDEKQLIDKQVKVLARAAADGRPAKLTPKNATKGGKKPVSVAEPKKASPETVQ